jgi:hypothetical protein
VSEEAERPELDAVRRLLAEARHDEPMPDDVAVRLEGVLAGLSRERGEAREDAPVIPLAAHRRRRAAALLVAAAAVVVGGVAVAQQLPRDPGGSATAGRSTAEDRVTAARGQSPTSEPPGKSFQASPGLRQLRIRNGGVLVRPGHITADARSARQAAGPAPTAAVGEAGLREPPPGCVPALGEVEVVRATYRKSPAALVYHAPAGADQVVDLYVCGAAKPVRSVTLPAS